jgi:hypothetical protein
MGLIFANEVRIEIDSHQGLEESKRPVYIFRRASVSESLDELHKRDFFFSGDYEEVFDMCVETIKRRLLRVEVDGKEKPEYMELLDTLADDQVYELFVAALLRSTKLSVLHKKKFKSLFSTPTEKSAEDAAPAVAVS